MLKFRIVRYNDDGTEGENEETDSIGMAVHLAEYLSRDQVIEIHYQDQANKASRGDVWLCIGTFVHGHQVRNS